MSRIAQHIKRTLGVWCWRVKVIEGVIMIQPKEILYYLYADTSMELLRLTLAAD
jgi:hypothetical protein